MPESFGDRLRQRREERQIDLIAIAGQTKIKLALLEALERDDVSQWPGGIFRRAYVRTYAQMIGLDPDATLREFVELYPDPGDTFTALGAAEAPDGAPVTSAGPPTRLRTIVESAIDSLARLRRPIPSEATARATAPPNVAVSPSEPEIVAPLPSASDVVAVSVALPEVEPKQETIERVEDTQPKKAAEPETPIEVRVDAARDVQALHDATLEAVAHVCTEIGRAADRSEARPLLRDAAKVLQAGGFILWNWDPISEDLQPALVHGYSEKVVSHLAGVKREADNATAAAFRHANACEVAATEHTSAALVVPLLMPEGCTGVLAIELQPDARPTPSLRAVAALVAAALGQFMQRRRRPEARPQIEEPEPAMAAFRAPVRPVKVRR
jgi:hypothetical protein